MSLTQNVKKSRAWGPSFSVRRASRLRASTASTMFPGSIGGADAGNKASGLTVRTKSHLALLCNATFKENEKGKTHKVALDTPASCNA